MNSYTINKDFSLLDALVQIEKNHHRSLIVLNDDKKVVGSLSDGDIRRALINRIVLSSKIYRMQYIVNLYRIPSFGRGHLRYIWEIPTNLYTIKQP